MTARRRWIAFVVLGAFSGCGGGESSESILREPASVDTAAVVEIPPAPAPETVEPDTASEALTESQSERVSVSPSPEQGAVTLREIPPSELLKSTVVVVVADSASVEVRILGVTTEQRTGRTVPSYIRDEGMLAVVSGAFLNNFFPPFPSGLLVVDGATINDLAPKDRVLSQVLQVRQGQLEIVDRPESITDDVRGAMQLGPRLISNQRITIDEREPDRRPARTRSFVGITDHGEYVFGITVHPVHLYDLARFLAASAEKGGLGVINAVNLSAGGMEALAVREDGAPRPRVFGPGADVRQGAVVALVDRGGGL